MSRPEDVILKRKGEKIEGFPIYGERGIGGKIKWIIYPFTHNLKEEIIVDGMYYPQRFIAPLLIGIVIFIYFAIILLNAITGLIDRYIYIYIKHLGWE